MANVTYRDLMHVLQSVDSDRLDDNIAICLEGHHEFFPVVKIEITDIPGILDKGHVYLSVND